MNEIIDILKEEIKFDLDESTILENLKQNFISKGFMFEQYKSQMSNDVFYKISDDVLIQVRLNLKFCPINEVPAIVAKTQTGVKKIIIANTLNGNLSFKEI